MGKRGFITFPSLGSLIPPPAPPYPVFDENGELQSQEEDLLPELPVEESQVTEISTSSGGASQPLHLQASVEHLSHQVSVSNLGINSTFSDVELPTCSALLTDLLPMPDTFDFSGNRSAVKASIGFTPSGYSSECLLGDSIQIPYGDRMHLRQARMIDIDTEKEKAPCGSGHV